MSRIVAAQRVVLKLGGSLATSSLLGHWLDAAARHGRGRLAIVPGGGPFADAVRALQRRLAFSDRAAHRMALLAMEQYGIALCDLAPGLIGCDSIAALERALERRLVPVWFPLASIDRAPDVAASWRETSDSIAAWLAQRLGAPRLVLVKSCAVATSDPRELARRGVVDPALPARLARGGTALAVLNKRRWRALPKLLDEARPARPARRAAP